MSDRKVKSGLAYDKKSVKLIKTGQYSDEALDELLTSDETIRGVIVSIVAASLFAFMYWIFK